MNTYPFEPVTRAMACKILNISLGTLDKHVRDGDLPPPRPLGNGRQLYWLPEEFFACVRRALQGGAVGATSVDACTTDASPPKPQYSTPPAAREMPPTRRNRRSTQPMSDRLKRLNA